MKLKLIKAAAPILSVGIAIAAVLMLIMYFKPMYDGAQTTGTALGTSAGEIVGTALGSLNGITYYREGWDAGKEQGLSAEDTESTIITHIIQGTGNLQVLVAGVTLDVSHEVGDKYAAIYLLRGEAVFMVNLNEAQIDIDQNTVTVMIPLPEVRLTVDETEVEKIAEWQTKFFNGSTDDGYIAYMNSIEQSKEAVAESISNYDELRKQAQEAAKEQVKMLVENMTGKEVNVSIFPGGEK